MLRSDNSEMQNVCADCAFAFDTGHTAAEVLRTGNHEMQDELYPMSADPHHNSNKNKNAFQLMVS